MKIIRNEVVENVPNIGAVSFEPLHRCEHYWRKHYGHTHAQAFRFKDGEREYWGTVTRVFNPRAAVGERTSYAIEIRTHGGETSRAVREDHKLPWRRELRRAFRSHLEVFIAAQEDAHLAR